MDELKHLKRLSAVKTNGGVKFLTPAAFPGNHCPMHTALAISSNIRGMSTLVVGTPECGNYSRNIIEKNRPAEETLHWMYVLDSNEVVFGCRKGLIHGIKEMDAAGARAIMVILTCVPEVIGEDMEGIIHEVQPQTKARLSYVQVAHFKCNSYPFGFWKTLETFGELMEPCKKRPDVINVLGRSKEEDHIPMPELLTALEDRGFILRYLAPKSDIEDFMTAPEAALSLVLSPYMNPLAVIMQQRFDVPFISLHEVYEVSRIDSRYKDVAQTLQIDLGHDLKQQREHAASLESKAREAVEGLRYVMTHRNPLMPLPLALYLEELNMEPVLLHMEEFYPEDKKWAKKLVEKGQNPMICHMVNEVADAPVLESLGPDVSFGEIPGGTGKIPCVPCLNDFYGQIGYERTANMLKRLLETLEPDLDQEGGVK